MSQLLGYKKTGKIHGNSSTTEIIQHRTENLDVPTVYYTTNNFPSSLITIKLNDNYDKIKY